MMSYSDMSWYGVNLHNSWAISYIFEFKRVSVFLSTVAGLYIYVFSLSHSKYYLLLHGGTTFSMLSLWELRTPCSHGVPCSHTPLSPILLIFLILRQ